MQVLEANKIIGAALLALLAWRGLDFVAELAYGSTHHVSEDPVYVVAAADAASPADAVPEEEVGLAVLLSRADTAAGEREARKCAACHTFDQGGPDRVGPNLWNVVGSDAGEGDFAFSPAMAGHGPWTYEALDAFLADPQGAVPGTKMVFPGIRDAAARADVIAYLRDRSDSPPPLPEVEEEPAPEMAEAETGESSETAPVEEEPAPVEETVTEEPVEETVAEQPAEAEEAAPVEEAAGEAVDEPAEAEPAADGVGALVAAADPAAGEREARICSACHTFDQGGAQRVGPNLWDVVGRDIAAVDGFNYSRALAERPGAWTYDALDDFLADPRGFAPGNKMAFPGISSEQKRAQLIAFLRSLSSDPAPLPGGG